MLKLRLPELGRPVRVLCLGAHSDDLEIGCGGTLLRLQSEREVSVTWVVWSATGAREMEARTSAESLLRQATDRTIFVRDFKDGYFPHIGAELKDAFEELQNRVEADLIFTHAQSDLHQDHRLVNELTWNTFRDHPILEYEVPKYDGDLGRPNLYIPLNEELSSRKIEHLMSHFPTQAGRHWFDPETFRGLMRLRGVEAGVRYAEAFCGRKLIL